MGIDTHTLKFLIFASRKKPLGRVATIGRAGLHVPKDKLRKIMKLDREVDYGGYCEDFLREQFDASAVESFDKSDYENATHIADMNLPLKVSSVYDTVIDGGCLEHIYNLPRALENISRLCADDGQSSTFCQQTIFAETAFGNSRLSCSFLCTQRVMATTKPKYFLRT